MLTDNQRKILNTENPTFQSMSFGDKFKSLEQYSAVQIPVAIVADATGGQTVTIPFNFVLTDVVVQCTAANAAGTATVRKSTTAISDAMIMAVDKVIVRAGTIDDAESAILTTDSINVITNGAADRGLVMLIGYRS